MYITEPQKSIPVKGNYDVIVVGGGIAGISAALAAARQNKKVLLLEKMFMLGGLATAGLVTIYLPLCDGRGRQVSFGIVEELLRLSVKHGYEPAVPAKNEKRGYVWLEEDASAEERKKHRFEVQFNAAVFAILCEQLLCENSVEILYGTSLCSCTVEDSKITSVITENKGGREAYTASSFVDATGDADLSFLSGAGTTEFKQGNLLASWYYEMINNTYRLNLVGASDIPDKYKTEESKNKKVRRYRALNGKELSEMVQNSHSNLLNHFLEHGGINREHSLANIATVPQVRMTRRINGAYTMNDEEQFVRFEDSIGLISDWRKAGPVYEIPFRCLWGEKIKNLIACGRCISVTDDMWDITRVIPACAVTGEAAGIAAAISDNFASLDYSELARLLSDAGAKLHIDWE